MELIIHILMLFIVINCSFKLSFWKLWQTVIYSLIAGLFVAGTWQYAILQSKTQIADYLQNTEALQNMAIIITLESALCFGYCVAFLRGLYGKKNLWWAELLRWYPSLLLFPVLFYYLTEAIFRLPGVDFSVTAWSFAGIVVIAIPLLSRLMKYLVPEDDLRLEVHFLVSLFICILGLLTTVNGKTTYAATEEALNWKAIILSIGLFVVLFLIGFWVANSLLIPDIIILLCLFVRSLILIGGTYNMYMTKRKNDKALDQLIKDARIDDLKAALPDKDNSLYMGYLRDLLYHPASADYSDFLITKFENEAEKDVSLSKMLAKIGPVLGLIGTLISMSPALVGLSTGDISGMAYNMQVVFATTVVGLVISAVGLISMQFKQRWYAKDVNNLDYVSRVLNETTGESNNEKK